AERVVAGLGPLRVEGRGHERAARKCHHTASEQAEERTAARARSEVLGYAFDALVQDHPVTAFIDPSPRRFAVSTSPSSCSRLLTVPLAWTTPSSSRITANGVPGTRYRSSAIGAGTTGARRRTP